MTSTPPNYPIYGVHISEEQIETIFRTVNPDVALVSSTRSAQSFNNRIYFLSIISDGKPVELVLKVNGRFFDGHKVENEVACLLMLARYCPEIPVPRLIAWSTDGYTVATPRDPSMKQIPTVDDTSTQIAHPWIIITRLPGRSMTDVDATGPHATHIARQLAEHYSQMRTRLPQQHLIGNLTLIPQSPSSSPSPTASASAVTDAPNDIPALTEAIDLSIPHLTTRPAQFLNHDIQPSTSVTNTSTYYAYLLADEIHKLNTRHPFGSIRARLNPKLSTFVSDTLPNLPFLTAQQAITFTHHDFSPRNVLITEPHTTTNADQKPAPTVSGIIDFEFAGFFPASEELLNAAIQQDWPEELMRIFETALQPSLHGTDSEVKLDTERQGRRRHK